MVIKKKMAVDKLPDAGLRKFLALHYDRITVRDACVQTRESSERPDLDMWFRSEGYWQKITDSQVQDLWQAHVGGTHKRRDQPAQSFCHFLGHDIFNLSSQEYSEVKHGLSSVRSEQVMGIYKSKDALRAPYALVLEFPTNRTNYSNWLLAGGSVAGTLAAGALTAVGVAHTKKRARELASAKEQITGRTAEITRISDALTAARKQVEAQADKLTLKSDELTTAQEQITGRTAEITRISDALTAARKQVEAQADQLTLKSDELTTAQERITALESKLNESDTINQSNSAELMALKSKLHESEELNRSNSAELMTQQANYELQLQGLRADLVKSRQRENELTTEENTLLQQGKPSQQQPDQTQVIERLTASTSTLEKEKNDALSKLSGLEQNIQQLQEANRRLQGDQQTRLQLLAESQRATEKVEASNLVLKNSNKLLTDNLAVTNTGLQQTTQEVERLKEVNTGITSQLDIAKTQLAQTESELSTTKTTAQQAGAQFTSKLLAAEEELSRLQSLYLAQLAAANTEFQAAKDAAQAASARFISQRAVLEEQSAQLEQKESVITRLNEELEEVQRSTREQQAEVTRTKQESTAELSRVRASELTLKQSNKRLIDQLAAAQTEMQNANTTAQEARAKVTVAQKEADTKSTQLQQKESEITRLNAELQEAKRVSKELDATEAMLFGAKAELRQTRDKIDSMVSEANTYIKNEEKKLRGTIDHLTALTQSKRIEALKESLQLEGVQKQVDTWRDHLAELRDAFATKSEERIRTRYLSQIEHTISVYEKSLKKFFAERGEKGVFLDLSVAEFVEGTKLPPIKTMSPKEIQDILDRYPSEVDPDPLTPEKLEKLLQLQDKI